MQIIFFLQHHTSTTNCIIRISTVVNGLQVQQLIDLSDCNKTLTVDLPGQPTKKSNVTIDFTCYDTDIVSVPLEITKILFDDFYSLPRLTYSGSRIIDGSTEIEKKSDFNVLNYVGTLRYQFTWPFFRMITL